uniref:Uncharacterized protein n=1 Tax=Setaria italica TaxID=4555 RepID=K4AKB2_SETIT
MVALELGSSRSRKRESESAEEKASGTCSCPGARAGVSKDKHLSLRRQHSETADENKHTEAVEATTTAKDDDAVEKRHQDPRTSEIYSPAEPGDEVEKPGRDL